MKIRRVGSPVSDDGVSWLFTYLCLNIFTYLSTSSYCHHCIFLIQLQTLDDINYITTVNDTANSSLTHSLQLISNNVPISFNGRQIQTACNFLQTHTCHVWLRTGPVRCKVSLQSLGSYDTLIIFVYNNNNNNNKLGKVIIIIIIHLLRTAVTKATGYINYE